MGTPPAASDDLSFSTDRVDGRSVVLMEVTLEASEPRRDGSADHISSTFDALDEETDMEGAVRLLLMMMVVLSVAIVAAPTGEADNVVFIIDGTILETDKVVSSVFVLILSREAGEGSRGWR